MMKLYSKRAGKTIHIPRGYDCFVPTSLSNIKIDQDNEMLLLLEQANLWTGKFDGVINNLPDKDIFIAKYVQKEAILSSQIEGTQASLSDVLQENKVNNITRKETEDVVNYVKAVKLGEKLLLELPFCTRYFNKLHKVLLNNTRGKNKEPGQIRWSQNWIGPKNCSLKEASFVPPSIEYLNDSLSDLEKYINNSNDLPLLIKISLIHYQFETIHPYLDGNGRVGRILIPLFLFYNKIISSPTLYISLFFKQNRTEYYGLLSDVRFKGHYEEWIKFFLRGIIETSKNSYDTINQIIKLQDNINKKVQSIKLHNKHTIIDVIKYLYKHPYIDSSDLIINFKISKPTASSVIKTLIKLKILVNSNNKKRYVVYRFDKYVKILEDGTEL